MGISYFYSALFNTAAGIVSDELGIIVVRNKYPAVWCSQVFFTSDESTSREIGERRTVQL